MRKFSANLAFVVSIFFITAVGVFSVFGQAASNEFASKSKDNAANANSTAQTADSEVFDKKNELSVLGGIAPEGRFFGGSRKSIFGFAAVQYSRRVASGKYLALKYQIDFTPLALINYDRQRVVHITPTTLDIGRERQTVYGVGFTPVGLQLNFRRKKKVQPFISMGAGIIFFAKSVPDDRSPLFPDRRGRQFNFTTSGGVGVEFATKTERAYTVGFKFHHISNASTGNINPGFDQNLFYFGYTFKKW
ncbi:MAG: acyloxyacyl hydrolase [Pyrinomonadaceae bacterium]